MNNRDWGTVVRALKKRYPTERPLTILRRKRIGTEGVTFFSDRSFKIVIQKNQSDSSQIYSLIHELAHVRAIEQACQHKGVWGELHGAMIDEWMSEFQGKL